MSARANFDLVRNQARARRLQPLDGAGQIADVQSDMVKALAAFGEKLPNGRVGRSRDVLGHRDDHPPPGIWVVRLLGRRSAASRRWHRSEEHTSELQSLRHLVCRLL